MIVMVIIMMQNSHDLLDVLGFIINPVVAICASVIAWLLSVKIFKPQMGISREIVTKEKKETENKTFNFKIQNQSFKREIYDISVYATYCFASKNYYSTRVRHLPILKVKASEPYEMKIDILGPQNRDGAQQSLEDFFDNVSNSGNSTPHVDIEIVAYDKFSGSVKYAYSQRYYKCNIKYEHVFRDGELESSNISDQSGHAI